MASMMQNKTFLETTPALAPPPGVVPNFVNPENRAYQGFAALSVMYALAMMILFVRLWIRLVILRVPGWDDFFAFMAGVVYTLTIAFSFVLLANFAGRHMWDVPLITFTDLNVRRVQLATQLLVPFTSLFFKLVILTLLLRIFPWRSHKVTAICTYVGIAVLCLFNLAILIDYWYICIPRAGSGGLQSAACRASQIPAIVNVFNFCMDIYIFIIPQPALARLHVTRKKRIGITIILGAGIITCICSALAFSYRFKYVHNPDATWYSIPQIIAQQSEQAAGIITGALPCFAAVGHHLKTVSLTRGEGILSDAKFLLTGTGSAARKSRATHLRSSDSNQSNNSANGSIRQIREVTIHTMPKDTDEEVYEFNQFSYMRNPHHEAREQC